MLMGVWVCKRNRKILTHASKTSISFEQKQDYNIFIWRIGENQTIVERKRFIHMNHMNPLGKKLEASDCVTLLLRFDEEREKISVNRLLSANVSRAVALGWNTI